MENKSKRINWLIICIIVIAFVIQAVFFWEISLKYLTITQKVDSVAVEINSEYEPKVTEFIDAPQFVLDRFAVDMSKVALDTVGEYTLCVSDGRRTYEVQITVEDTQAPVIEAVKKNEFNVIVGSDISVYDVESMLQITDASAYTVWIGNQQLYVPVTAESVQDGKILCKVIVIDEYGNRESQEIEITENILNPDEFPEWYQVASEDIQHETIRSLRNECTDIADVEERFGLAGWEAVAEVVNVQLEVGVDPFDKYLVYGELASMQNPELMQKFDDCGWKIIIANSDGYLNGEDYGLKGEMAGITAYDYHWIKLPGKRIDDLRDSNVDIAVYHEMGHFVDWYFSYPSKTKEFKSIYREENESCLGLGDADAIWAYNYMGGFWLEDEGHTEYIRQNSEEYFAEFFCYLVQYQNLDKYGRPEYELLENNIEDCPKTYEYVQRYVDITKTPIDSMGSQITVVTEEVNDVPTEPIQSPPIYSVPTEDEYWWDVPVLPEGIDLGWGEIPM